VARGIDGRPRSAARQGTAGPFGRHGGEAARRRALVAACASTGRARRGRRARSSGVGRQRRGTARQRGGSEAARPRQRHSEARAGGAQVPARAQSREGRVSEGEREEREKGSGERNKSQRFDLVQTRNFQLKLEKI